MKRTFAWMFVLNLAAILVACLVAAAGAVAQGKAIASRLEDVDGVRLRYLTAGDGPAVSEFRAWKDRDECQEAFGRLRGDLKAEDEDGEVNSPLRSRWKEDGGAVPVDVEKKCSGCGEAFLCRQEPGCWCASVRVDPATAGGIANAICGLLV